MKALLKECSLEKAITEATRGKGAKLSNDMLVAETRLNMVPQESFGVQLVPESARVEVRG